MEKGLYKNTNNTLAFAENGVTGKNYTLKADPAATYPQQGWYYFNSKSEAIAHFGITIAIPWHDAKCNYRIVAPKTLISVYPQLLYDLTVVRKLQLEDAGQVVLIYCNTILPEHQALIDGSQGAITIETK